MKNKVCSVIVLQFLLYIFQFIVMPLTCPNYYPESNEASAVFFISTAAFALIGELFIKCSFGEWLLGDIIYLVCAFIYCGDGNYGIGLSGLFEGTSYDRSNSWLSLLIYGTAMLITQAVIMLITRLIIKIRNKK